METEKKAKVRGGAPVETPRAPQLPEAGAPPVSPISALAGLSGLRCEPPRLKQVMSMLKQKGLQHVEMPTSR